MSIRRQSKQMIVRFIIAAVFLHVFILKVILGTAYDICDYNQNMRKL